MVAINSTSVGRGRGRPVQRVERRRAGRAARRKVLPLAVGTASARPLLASFFPDDDFRRGSKLNLPLVTFALLALLFLVLVVWSIRQ